MSEQSPVSLPRRTVEGVDTTVLLSMAFMRELVDSNLSRGEMRLLLFLVSTMNADGIVNTTQGEMANRLGTTRPRLNEAVRKLSGRGLVHRLHNGSYQVADGVASTSDHPVSDVLSRIAS